MKIKKLTPRNVAPVQRENTATISRDQAAIAPSTLSKGWYFWPDAPFAGDDAE